MEKIPSLSSTLSLEDALTQTAKENQDAVVSSNLQSFGWVGYVIAVGLLVLAAPWIGEKIGKMARGGF